MSLNGGTGLAAVLTPGRTVQETFMNAVVKVLCVHSNPNFSLPWQRKRQFTSTSSGFMVRAEDGQRWLLTNAHSVEYYAQVSCLFWVA